MKEESNVLNESKKKASIIMPVYNTEKYLDEAIKSVLRQTFQDWELILVDDGSTDTSGEICDIYSEKDNRIYAYHTDNSGALCATFFGIERSQSDCIFIIDSDDWVEPNMIEEMMTSFEENKCDMVCAGRVDHDFQGNVQRIINNNVKCGYYSNIEEMKYIKRNLFLSDSDCDYNIGGFLGHKGTKGISAELAKAVARELKEYEEIKNVKLYEDRLFSYCCLLRAHSVKVTDSTYYHYRYNEESVFRSKNCKFLSGMEVYDNIMRKQIALYGTSDMTEQWERWYIFTLLKGLKKYKNINPLASYKCPVMDDLKGKKVVIFGAGQVGVDYYNDFLNNDIDVVLWTDNSKKKREDYQLSNADDIMEKDFDYVVCAAASEMTMKRIKEQLVEMGIDKDVILCEKPIDKWFSALIKDGRVM